MPPKMSDQTASDPGVASGSGLGGKRIVSSTYSFLTCRP